MIYAVRFPNYERKNSYGTMPTGDTDFPYLYELCESDGTHVWTGDGEKGDWWRNRICSWMIVVDGT